MSDTDDFYEDDEDDQNDSAVIKGLRKKAREGAQAIKERDELRSENQSLKARTYLNDAGLSGLKPSQQKAVLALVEGDPSVEALKEAAVELGFVEPDTSGAASEDAQRQMAGAAANAGTSGGGNVTDMVTPQDFGTWDMTRRVDFMDRHPEKFAALERGETIRVA